MFRTFSKLEILRPAKTRFAYMMIVLQRLVKVQDALRQTVMCDAWKSWPGSKEADALRVQQVTFNPDMWKLGESLIRVLQPIYSVLRMTDREGCTLGLYYEFMDKLGASLKSKDHHGIQAER